MSKFAWTSPFVAGAEMTCPISCSLLPPSVEPNMSELASASPKREAASSTVLMLAFGNTVGRVRGRQLGGNQQCRTVAVDRSKAPVGD